MCIMQVGDTANQRFPSGKFPICSDESSTSVVRSMSLRLVGTFLDPEVTTRHLHLNSQNLTRYTCKESTTQSVRSTLKQTPTNLVPATTAIAALIVLSRENAQILL